MNIHTKWIMEVAKVSATEALKIQDVIDNKDLIRWSEASKRQIAKTVKLAQTYIANGNSWELA